MGMRRAMLKKSSYGGGFDPAYQAVLDYATLQGYTLPSAAQQILQNQLVLDLKVSGTWDKLDVFYNFATDASLEFSFINWINPSIAFITYIASQNYKLITNSHIQKINIAISHGLLTNFTPSNNGIKWQLNNASFGWKQLTATGFFITDSGVIFGASNGLTQNVPACWIYEGNYVCRVWLNKSGSAVYFGNAFRGFTSASNSTFNIGLNSSVLHLFKNETQLTSVAQTPDGITSKNIILLQNSSNKDRQFQYVYFGEYFTSLEQTSLLTDYTNYLNSL